jgi:3'(2'), 5'-bisphosphate nucleotidase
MWMSTDPRQHPGEAARRLGAIAVEAGRFLASVAVRASGTVEKHDGSPTTAADRRSEALILDRLREAWPGIPAIAEESAPPGLAGDLFFLVDPLDGTRDYLSGTGEYSVNIALVSRGRPIAAAIAAPAQAQVWVAGEVAETSPWPQADRFSWERASTRRTPPHGPVALVSRRHGDPDTERCLNELAVYARRVASSAYKFCLIASGEADVYVRCGPTMEWDTAAGDHIVARAGGCVLGPSGPLTYGHAERGFLNGPFAAYGDPELAARVKLPPACA